MDGDEFHSLELTAQRGHDRADQQLIQGLLHARSRPWARIYPITFETQHMHLNVLVLIDAHGAVHLNRHDSLDAACIDVQIQAHDHSIIGHRNDLHIRQCPFLQSQLRHKHGGERCLVQR